MNKIGIVFVNYNDSLEVIKRIEEINEYKSIKKIVVVDNKSDDKNIKLLKNIDNSKVHIIYNKNNLGYAAALNEGCQYLYKLKYNYVICSNTDVFINSNKDIELLVQELKDDIVCIMPTIKENNLIKKGWKLTNSYIDLINNIPYINRFYKDKFIKYKNDYYKGITTYIDVIYGCFFMIDLEILNKIDYFDPNTFLYYEENILARKLKDINKKSVVHNEIILEHRHNKVIGNNISIKKKYNIYKDSQYYYEKKYNKANKFILFLFKIFRKIGSMK